MSSTFTQTIYYQRKPHVGSTKRFAYAMGMTYFWMALGILITSFTAFLAANSPWLQQLMQKSKELFYFLIFTQFIAAALIGLYYRKCHYYVTLLLFIAYTAITGVTLSTIFIFFELASIINVFAVTSIGFIGLSLYGIFTKQDLNRLEIFCIYFFTSMSGLLIISFLLPSHIMETLFPVWSLSLDILFAIIIAADIQYIKNHVSKISYQNIPAASLCGATLFYLYFLILFLRLLNEFVEKKQ